jgi:hypothetical protein
MTAWDAADDIHGVQLEPGAAANLGHGPRISTADSPVSVWVIPQTRGR